MLEFNLCVQILDLDKKGPVNCPRLEGPKGTKLDAVFWVGFWDNKKKGYQWKKVKFEYSLQCSLWYFVNTYFLLLIIVL